MKGVSWIGRHYYVSKDLVKGPTRPYTVCISLGDSWTIYRNAVVEFFDKKMQGNEGATLSATLPAHSGNVNLVIKQYHNPHTTALSEHIHNHLGQSGNILINGPVGQGLDIHDNAKGTHYAFAVGTGVLPFMDLLNFILFKSMYLALKQKFGPAVAQQIVPQGIDYEGPLSSNFKLVLVASFANSNDAVGYEIIRKTAEINAIHNLGLFEAHVRGGADDPHVQKIASRIDANFVKEKVGKDATRFLVCGSPAFNEQIPNILKGLTMDSNRISLV